MENVSKRPSPREVIGIIPAIQLENPDECRLVSYVASAYVSDVDGSWQKFNQVFGRGNDGSHARGLRLNAFNIDARVNSRLNGPAESFSKPVFEGKDLGKLFEIACLVAIQPEDTAVTYDSRITNRAIIEARELTETILGSLEDSEKQAMLTSVPETIELHNRYQEMKG